MSVKLQITQKWEVEDPSGENSSIEFKGTFSVPDPILDTVEEQKDFFENVYPAFAGNTIKEIIGYGLLDNPFSIGGDEATNCANATDSTFEA